MGAAGVALRNAIGAAMGLVFSLVLAFAIYYGFGISKLLALLVFPATIIPAILLGFMMPGYMGVFAAFSFPVAAWLSRRIGLVNTMVFTHIPSNLLLMIVP